MFWIIAAVVVVALFALAWWTSGRKRPGAPGINMRRGDTSRGDATLQAEVHRGEPPGGGGPSSF